ncbi:GNAT family N-acetyltransferase [Salinispira pacifica]
MQWIDEPVVLSLPTGRVRLEPMRPSHVRAIFDARGDAETWRYMPAEVRTLDDADTLVERALAAKAAGTEYPFVIVDKTSNRVVGSTRYLDISPLHRSVEIGWTWIEPAARRTSINTECKMLLLAHAFESLGCVRVQIKTDARNAVSQRAIERLGCVREGLLRRHRILPDGFIRDTVYYSIIAEEWSSARSRLADMLGHVPKS